MNQISPFLRKAEYGCGHCHWCPGCEEMHEIPASWSFDGNVDAPTFSPSVKITGKQVIKLDGKWTGEWVRDANGNTVDYCCHYILTAGILNFCADSTHVLDGHAVPIPELPADLRDEAAS